MTKIKRPEGGMEDLLKEIGRERRKAEEESSKDEEIMTLSAFENSLVNQEEYALIKDGPNSFKKAGVAWYIGALLILGIIGKGINYFENRSPVQDSIPKTELVAEKPVYVESDEVKLKEDVKVIVPEKKKETVKKYEAIKPVTEVKKKELPVKKEEKKEDLSTIVKKVEKTIPKEKKKVELERYPLKTLDKSKKIENIVAENYNTLPSELKKLTSKITLSKGKYLVDSGILIMPKGVLTIQPGVELYMKKGVKITSYGAIKAVGTESNKIVFTAHDKNQRWKNIAIAGKYNKSIFENCVISYGSGRKGVPDSKYLSEVMGFFTAGGGIMIVHSLTHINNCIISNNKAAYGGGIYVANARPTIQGNIIENNVATDFGGGVAGFACYPKLYDNTVRGNKAKKFDVLYLYNGSKAKLKNNSWYDPVSKRQVSIN